MFLCISGGDESSMPELWMEVIVLLWLFMEERGYEEYV
jgi:hypothetical protein